MDYVTELKELLKGVPSLNLNVAFQLIDNISAGGTPPTPDYQDKTVTPRMQTQTVTADAGKTLRNVTVYGDSNLVAANIKQGVTIFNVLGTYDGT